VSAQAASVAREARAERLGALVAERELDELIVGDLVNPGDAAPGAMANLRWLTGFTGTSGLALVAPSELLFFTDFRYVERARREVVPGFEHVQAERQLVPALAKRLRGRVGYDDAHTSVKVFRRLEELAPDGVELVPAAGLVERLRRSKDEGELAAIAAAAELTDGVYDWIRERGLAGRSEREVARAIEARYRELGAEPSFPPIVAAGENGAIGHHDPSEREIGRRELVVVDTGSVVDGYCSDCTRTLASGPVGEPELEIYELVARAQAAGLEAVRAGAEGVKADAAAREVIAAAGHGERFGHGLGHGVGLEVHEAPRLAPTSEDVLEVGDVVTVEPGVYLPGRFGVRIEDLVVVTEAGCRILSGWTKELVTCE